MRYQLLCVGHDAKTCKGEKHGYLTGIMYLAPHKLSGLGNVCPHASHGCAKGCLNTAGRGIYANTQNARIRKTRLFFQDRLGFLSLLRFDLEILGAEARLRKLMPCVRLNGTSDLPWEKYGIMQEFAWLQFYDYTKNPQRMHDFLTGEMPANYHLTFSRSERNDADCLNVLRQNGNVAVVFRHKPLPATWDGFPVTCGDETDLRFLDGTGLVVGLTAKGRAKQDTSGFVVT